MLTRPALSFVLAVLALVAPGAAGAMDARTTGEITAEIADQEEGVKAKYGNRSWKEMSPEERKSFQKDMDQAREDTFKKHGTTERELETTQLKMGKKGLESAESGKKDYAAKKKAAAEAKAAKPKQAGEIKVQRGFSDENPVDLNSDGPDPETEGMGKVIEVPQDGAAAQP